MLVFVFVYGCALKYNVNKFPIEKYIHVHVYFFQFKTIFVPHFEKILL